MTSRTDGVRGVLCATNRGETGPGEEMLVQSDIFLSLRFGTDYISLSSCHGNEIVLTLLVALLPLEVGVGIMTAQSLRMLTNVVGFRTRFG